MEPRFAAIHTAVRSDGGDAAPGVLSGARTVQLAVAHHDTIGDDERIVLRATAGDAMLVLGARGNARLDALDRETGAAFVDAIALALGTPLGPPALAGASRALRGTFVRGGTHRDAGGLDWDVIALALSGTRIVLRVSGDRAVLVEIDRARRDALVTALDRALGAARSPAPRRQLRLGAHARLAVAPAWIARCPDTSFDDARGRFRARGCDQMRVVDPLDRACLDLTSVPCGEIARVDDLLRSGLAGRGLPAPHVTTLDRGDLELAWHDDRYDAEDPELGGIHPACSRLLVAANRHVHVLATYSYWQADATWAAAEWDRIVSTLELRELRTDVGTV